MFKMDGKPVIELMTVDKAKYYLSINTFSGQRPILKSIINLLEDRIENGTFRTGEVAIARLEYENNRSVIMNGQHQAHIVVKTGKPILVKLEKYICELPEDASELFRQFDATRRSLPDMVRVERMALGIDWSVRVCSVVVSAACLIKGGQQLHATKKVELIKDYLKQGAFISYIFDKSVPENVNCVRHTAHMMRSPVVATMILTWEKHHEDAKVFWLKIRDGENLKSKDPEYRLREFLKTVSYTREGKSKNEGYRTCGIHEMMFRSIRAWNAFRTGQSTDLKYSPAARLPKIV